MFKSKKEEKNISAAELLQRVKAQLGSAFPNPLVLKSLVSDAVHIVAEQEKKMDLMAMDIEQLQRNQAL